MLDRTKIVKALSDCSGSFLSTFFSEQQAAREVWNFIAQDEDLCDKLAPHRARYVLPAWQGPVAQKTNLISCNEYSVVAVDGSQIYPNRHQPIDCYVINIGVVCIQYGPTLSTVQMDSTPFVQLGKQNENREDNEPCTPEIVNAQRTYKELAVGLEWMAKLQPQTSCRLLSNQETQALFLFDGSLIFWHLKQPKTAEEYALLDSYIALVESFFEKRFCIAGYISKPGGKELVNIVRSALNLYPHLKEALLHKNIRDFTHSTDTDIATLFLEPGQRSGVFCSQAAVADYYPEHSKPYFFYINTGYEIARIEIPAWIAVQPRYLDFLAHAIYDQVTKGHGYPVVLAEAHEQAVISHAESAFFHHLLSLMATKANNNFANMHAASVKSSKKARPPV